MGTIGRGGEVAGGMAWSVRQDTFAPVRTGFHERVPQLSVGCGFENKAMACLGEAMGFGSRVAQCMILAAQFWVRFRFASTCVFFATSLDLLDYPSAVFLYILLVACATDFHFRLREKYSRK